jgi:uncharacterized membrane-anchored protein YhcB (DUF1043 family)
MAWIAFVTGIVLGTITGIVVMGMLLVSKREHSLVQKTLLTLANSDSEPEKRQPKN